MKTLMISLGNLNSYVIINQGGNKHKALWELATGVTQSSEHGRHI